MHNRSVGVLFSERSHSYCSLESVTFSLKQTNNLEQNMQTMSVFVCESCEYLQVVQNKSLVFTNVLKSEDPSSHSGLWSGSV